MANSSVYAFRNFITAQCDCCGVMIVELTSKEIEQSRVTNATRRAN